MCFHECRIPSVSLSYTNKLISQVIKDRLLWSIEIRTLSKVKFHGYKAPFLAWHVNVHRCASIILIVRLTGVLRPTREFFTHNYRWMDANFDLCSALMAIEQWGFFSVPHLLWHGHPFIMVISEDPWHLYLLPSGWQWSWHDLGLWRLGFEHPWNLPHARQTAILCLPLYTQQRAWVHDITAYCPL